MKTTEKKMYLDYYNNFLTIESFANYYMIDRSEAIRIIKKYKNEKNYVFIYEDRQRNELKREIINFDNIQEARRYSKDICFNSMLNDLYKVRVKRIY
jgi:hypothetical protein